MLTEKVILAVLLASRPDISEPRAEVIARATATVGEEFAEHPVIAATLLTAMEQESNFLESVHTGELRGQAGEICMTQIHPANGFWKGYVAEFDDLAGLDLESTTNCLRVAAHTLSWSLRKCLRENYKTNWAQAMWTRYHYGSRCWLSPHAYKRTRRMWAWQAKLRQEEQGSE